VTTHVLRVFVNEKGEFGNPVGIIVDEKQKISPKERQNIATRLGFSEAVFVNNSKTGSVSIFNPQSEIDFAGHALVGAAFFLAPMDFLETRSGRFATWRENDLTWIRADLKNLPPWHLEHVVNVSSVDNFALPREHTMVWAWINQVKGIIRARTFAPDWGIPEDEANGSGSMQLAAMLERSLEIHHGKGSIIYAKSAEAGFADVGGRVIE
jgi:predicted PhzF superfamily epimerase YddE/YHI9